MANINAYKAANEKEQLDLTIREGDICARLDHNKLYIALNDANGSMSDWRSLLTLDDAVTSVDGQVGEVDLSGNYASEADVVHKTGDDDIHGAKKFFGRVLSYHGEGEGEYGADSISLGNDNVSLKEINGKARLAGSGDIELAPGGVTRNLGGLDVGGDIILSGRINNIDIASLQGEIDNKQPSLNFDPENSRNRGRAWGYPSLDGDGKVPMNQLPDLATTMSSVKSVDGRAGAVDLSDAYAALVHKHSSADIADALGFIPEDPTGKGQAGGYAALDDGGKVPDYQLPDSVSKFHAADSETAQLKLTVKPGDICAREDFGKSYIALNDLNNSMDCWRELRRHPSLDDDGKVPKSQLPNLAFNVHRVSDEPSQLGLTVNEGDVCVRLDQARSYIAIRAKNDSMGDWQELLAPSSKLAGRFGDISDNQWRYWEELDQSLKTTDDVTHKNLALSDLKVDAGVVRTDQDGKLASSAVLPDGTKAKTQPDEDDSDKIATTRYADAGVKRHADDKSNPHQIAKEQLGLGETHSVTFGKVNGRDLEADGAKLDGIDDNANNYVHPTSHSADMILQTNGRKFVSDDEKALWSSKQEALDFAPENTVNKGKTGGYASLDEAGKVPDAQLPDPAFPNIYRALNEKEQLALSVQKGDVCARMDEHKTYIARNYDNASMNDWQEILSPAVVESVDGRDGAVSLGDLYEPKNTNIQSHIGDKSNPHLVTKEQLNLGEDNEVAFAGVKAGNLESNQIVETGADNRLISNPKGDAYNKNFGFNSGDVAEGHMVVRLTEDQNITGHKTFDDATIKGGLTISGGVKDNILTLNSAEDGEPVENSGLEIKRGTMAKACVLWDETDKSWKAGEVGALEELILETDSRLSDARTCDNTFKNPGAALSNLGLDAALKELSAFEIQQLQKIDEVAIKNEQWKYLGDLDQNLKKASDAIHKSLVLSELKVGNGVVRTDQDGKLASSDTLPDGTKAKTQPDEDDSDKIATTRYADAGVKKHVDNKSNPHRVTKEQLRLGIEDSVQFSALQTNRINSDSGEVTISANKRSRVSTSVDLSGMAMYIGVIVEPHNGSLAFHNTSIIYSNWYNVNIIKLTTGGGLSFVHSDGKLELSNNTPYDLLDCAWSLTRLL